MNITLHIERLVLDGLPLAATDAATVRAAVQTELIRRLTEGGLAPGLERGGALAGLRAPEVRLSPDAAPESVGHRIGAAIHDGLRT